MREAAVGGAPDRVTRRWRRHRVVFSFLGLVSERFHRILLEEWAYIRDWHSETERHLAYDGFMHFCGRRGSRASGVLVDVVASRSAMLGYVS